MFGDRKAETGATVPSCRQAVGLHKGFENLVSFSVGMPIPVSLTSKEIIADAINCSTI
jgi:hypothetical protein